MNHFTSSMGMKLIHSISLAALLTLPLAGLAEDSLKKPKEKKPEPFEELVKDPNYKRAPLLTQPGSPLSAEKIQPGGGADADTVWNLHKRAMHLKALKRSGMDNPHLGATIAQLRAEAEPESGFEDVDMKGDDKSDDAKTKEDNLTIFRFTNMGSFINGAPGSEERRKALKAAIALGKAFFWDVNFSSNGTVSCASCHYAAGSDHRTRGVVSLPANFGIRAPWPRRDADCYQPYELTSSDLISGGPEVEGTFARGLFDPQSVSGFGLREVIGSLGVPHRYFAGLDAGKKETTGKLAGRVETQNKKLQAVLDRIDTIEQTYRQVTPRNAGTVINAVFNSRNFHDSRASMVFNGHTGWGEHDDALVKQATFVWRDSGVAGAKLEQIYTWSPTITDAGGQSAVNPHYIANAALASQAMEPIVSDVEMSYVGRMFHHIARRMLDAQILGGSTIDPTDSSLADYGAEPRTTYRALVETAFRPEWRSVEKKVSLITGPAVDPAGNAWTAEALRPEMFSDYTQMEANFGLIWGLAIHLYESTLISDRSPFDIEQQNVKSSTRAATVLGKTITGNALYATQPLSAAARRGLDLFRKVGCVECHAGAEFSAASISEIGLLRARAVLQIATPTTAATFGPAAGLFAVPADPLLADVIAEEDDIVAGALLCPPEKPLGVECMDLGGRFESLYDGGNYNIGVSRYLRRPSWPDSPPLPIAAGINSWPNPSVGVALWEDSGNGNAFIPKEAGLRPKTPLKVALRAAFGLHLLRDESKPHVNSSPTEMDKLLRILTPCGPDGKPNVSAPLAAPAPVTLNVLKFQARDANFLAATESSVLGETIAATAAATLTPPAAIRDAALAIMKDRTHALNYTQQAVLTEKTPPGVLETVRKADVPPVEISGSAAERNLTFTGNVPIVTPATPPPPHSLARRWFEAMDETIARAQKELDAAAATPSAARIATLRRQIDALQRLRAEKERIADGGAFKVPTLRNIELTGPYMHNGSLLTLEAVVDFYSRGGDYNRRVRANEEDFKTGDQHPEMAPLNLSTEDKADLVAFLKSLTDPRVRHGQAPFDHPSLNLPLGPENPDSTAGIKISEVGSGGSLGGSSKEIVPFEREMGKSR